MFGHTHYVPLLRCKPAEISALGALASADRQILTPILEVLSKDFEPDKNGSRKPAEDVVLNRIAQIYDAWEDRLFFCDVAHIPYSVRGSGRRHILSSLCEHAREIGCSLIPVLGLNSRRRHVEAAREATVVDNNGLCLRITTSEISSPGFHVNLRNLIRSVGLRSSEIDMILDGGYVGSDPPRIEFLVQQLPQLNSWRSVTFLAGAFPKDLSEFSVGEHNLTRTEWITWRDFMLRQTRVTRRPAFGDYTIQHGIYREPPPKPNFSASIRYTAESHWVIMRGECVFKEDGPGFHQWPANAQMLIDRPEFDGEAFSFGDAYIYEMANQTEKPGSAETWLRAGINRHLTYVGRQIASFFGAPVVV